MTDLVRRLARRRLAVLLVVVLALVAAAGGWASAGSSKQSGAAVLIIPPVLGDAVSDRNPLINLDNNLAQLATVLATAMQSSQVSDALAAQGATGSFTISTVTGTNPSFSQLSAQMIFTVSGSDAVVTKRTATALVAQAKVQLAALQTQAKVPAAARASLVQVVAPTDGETVGSGKLRSAGSIGLAVLVLGLLLVLLIDQLLARRRGGPDPDADPRGGRRRHSARI